MADQDIIQSLEQIKLRVQEELGAVREYRALLNVQKAIEEVSGIDEVTGPLEQIVDQLKLRMKDMREYQALGAVEKSIGKVSEVLDLLDTAARKRAPASPPAAGPKDAFAGVKFAPGLVGKPESGKPPIAAAVQPVPAAAPPAPLAVAPEFAPAAPPQMAAAPQPAPASPPKPPALDDIEADIANVLRVGDRLRLKN